MKLNAAVRLILLVIGLFLLHAVAWIGIEGGIIQFHHARSLGEKTQTALQFAYGVFAILAVVTTFWRREWNRTLLGYWAVSMTLAGGFARADSLCI